MHRLSRPADTSQAVSVRTPIGRTSWVLTRLFFFSLPQRITYNTRYFSGNYTLIVLVLAVYALYVRPSFRRLGTLISSVGREASRVRSYSSPSDSFLAGSLR